MRMQKIILGVTLALLFGAAQAASVTSNIPVSTQVVPALPTCQITTAPLNFGIYDPASGLAANSTTFIAVNCSVGATYSLGFSSANNGGGAGSLVPPLGGNALIYQISDVAYPTADMGLFTYNPIIGLGTGIQNNHLIYASIFGGQATNLPASYTNQSYSDTLVVHLNY
jgi:spore coat protein U-like protein